MSRRLPADETMYRQILANLAASPAAFGNLLAYGDMRLAKEETDLNEAARQALVDPQKRDGALLQYGRVTMLRDLLTFARTFQKS